MKLSPLRASKAPMLRTRATLALMLLVVGFVPASLAAQAPVVTLDRVRAAGPLSRGAARRTVEGALSELRTCYGSALAARADLAGTLELRIMVSSDGGVVAASVAARSFEHGELERCVSHALMALRFTARDAGFTTVRLTVRFGRARVRRSELQATGEGAMGGADLFSMDASGAAAAFGEGRLRDGRVAVQQAGLSVEVVRRVLRQRRRLFLYCYERELVDNASLAGRVELRFVVGARGRVQTAMVHGSTLGSAIDGCLVSQLRRLRFPEPEGGGTVQIRYPLTFSPAS